MLRQCSRFWQAVGTSCRCTDRNNLLSNMVTTRNRKVYPETNNASKRSVRASSSAAGKAPPNKSQPVKPSKITQKLKEESVLPAPGSLVVIEESTVEDVQVEVSEKKGKKGKKKALESTIPEADLPVLRAKASKIYNKLMELYENPPCPLDHNSDFQLLVAIILSAQSTDKKVCTKASTCV
jgi:hypothetical protein